MTETTPDAALELPSPEDVVEVLGDHPELLYAVLRKLTHKSSRQSTLQIVGPWTTGDAPAPDTDPRTPAWFRLDPFGSPIVTVYKHTGKTYTPDTHTWTFESHDLLVENFRRETAPTLREAREAAEAHLTSLGWQLLGPKNYREHPYDPMVLGPWERHTSPTIHYTRESNSGATIAKLHALPRTTNGHGYKLL